MQLLQIDFFKKLKELGLSRLTTVKLATAINKLQKMDADEYVPMDPANGHLPASKQSTGNDLKLFFTDLCMWAVFFFLLGQFKKMVKVNPVPRTFILFIVKKREKAKNVFLHIYRFMKNFSFFLFVPGEYKYKICHFD